MNTTERTMLEYLAVHRVSPVDATSGGWRLYGPLPKPQEASR